MSGIHEYFKRTFLEWDIEDFLNKFDIEQFDIKIDKRQVNIFCQKYSGNSGVAGTFSVLVIQGFSLSHKTSIDAQMTFSVNNNEESNRRKMDGEDYKPYFHVKIPPPRVVTPPHLPRTPEH
ncbi:23219_t:CDS:2 [Rhizophagus irregularis]|nr:23219_t:CDS:2 [Rhizophagus irregularis]